MNKSNVSGFSRRVFLLFALLLASRVLTPGPAGAQLTDLGDGVLVPQAQELSERHRVTVPKLSSPPRIDGLVDADEWAAAAILTGFVRHADAFLFPYSTQSYLGWDEEALYVAFRVATPPGTSLTANYGPEERDQALFNDDSLEVWLKPGPVAFGFLVNTRGARTDLRSDLGWWSRRAEWNPAWEAAVRETPEGFEAELRIPFSALETAPPVAGDEWTFNLCRYQVDVPGMARRERAEFAFMFGAFTGSDRRYATLRFEEHLVARSDGIGLLDDETAGFRGQLTNLGTAPRTLRVRTRLYGAAEHGEFRYAPSGIEHPLQLEPLADAPIEEELTLAPGESRSVLQVGRVEPGTYLVGVTIQDEGAATLYAQNLPFAVAEPLMLQVQSRYLLRDAFRLSLRASPRFEVRPGTEIRFALERDGTVLRSVTVALEERRAMVEINALGLAPGEYTVRAQAWADGDLLDETWQALSLPEKPAWFTDPVGHTDNVLPPWEPVHVEDDTVSVWGRRHQFSSDSPFPEQIISQGRELLAGQPRLVVEADAPLTWERGAIERQPHRARFAARGRSGALEARAEVTLAYEGLNRFVIELDPQEPVALRSAVLEIPLRREYVNLISLYGAGNRSDAWRHQSPAGRANTGGRGPVSENVMFNDMDTGLSWFLATPRGDWPVRDREQMMEIVPEGETVTLRVWIADRPVVLTEPIRIDMALLALPVMPRPKDPITWYIGQVGGVDSLEAYQEFVNIHYPAHGHVDADGFLLDLWIRPTGTEPGALVAFDDGAHWLALAGAGEDWVLRSGDLSGERQPPLRFGSARWTPGEWTHLRVHWQGLGTARQQLVVWQDGVPAGDLETDSVAVDLYPARMVLGGLHNRIRSHFDLDAVRIERGAAAAAADAPERPILTERTVLLDTFREPIQQNSIFDTRAERVSGLSAETGGVPHFLSRYLPGRWGHALSLDWEQEHLLIDIMERFGYRGFYAGEGGYWDRWGRWEISDPDRLERCLAVAQEAQRRGMTFMHYFCNYISPLDEENFALRAELEKLPPQPFRHTTMLNVRRPAQDYVVWQLQDVMKRFGVTGLHLDFHAGYFPDQNELAGSGWRDAAGQLHPTWDYYDVWTQQRRIYALCHEYPLTDGVIMTHAGPSSLPWTTYKMSGEGSRTMESLLPLDAYRSGSTMGPTGIPKQFDTKHHHDNHNEILAVTLLHNDPARIWSGMINRHWTRRPTLADPYAPTARPQCLLMAVRRRFDMAGAEFLPYWNEVPVQSDPDGPVISLWRHTGKRSLLVVSNLTRDPAPNVRLELDLEALGLSAGAFTAYDAYTRRNLPIEGPRVTVDIGPANYRLIWLEQHPAAPPPPAAHTE